MLLTGANGIGKTTLLKSILGLIPPISGEVEQGDYLEIGYFEQEMAGVDTHLSGRNLAGVSGIYPVRGAFRPCKMRTDHEAYREQGACIKWW